MRRRRFAAAALLVMGAAACSGKDDASGPDVAGPSAASDTPAAVVSVASTTTITTVATTPAPTTPPPSAAPLTTTAPPPTAAATGEYQPATAPAFPTRSSPPPSEGLPDGSYYAVLNGADAHVSTPRVTMTIYQLLTGPEAIAAAQADGHGLDSDLYVPAQPAAQRDLELRADLVISVARPDRPNVSYAVSPTELTRLVNGGPPSPGAPDGYRYVPFPFLVTVAGGVPTRLEQLWAP
jgi:hypothetical protein